MADDPRPDRQTQESAFAKASGRAKFPSDADLLKSGSGSDADLAALAALFAAQVGGSLPAQVSADLALEIVLNEIVEQACLATGATGAAIGLLRADGEMVCRASSGENAPALGARLSSVSGLTAECVASGEAQRCDDAQVDARADTEASRSLGVRSVMIYPLLRDGDPLGVLEIFSPQAAVFGKRDEATLEVLSQRVLKNLELARTPISAEAKIPAPSVSTQPAARDLPDEFAAGISREADREADKGEDVSRRRENERVRPPRRDLLRFSLATALVVCAVALGTLLGVGLGWRRSLKDHDSAARSKAMGERRESPQEQERPGNEAMASPGAVSASSSASVATDGLKPGASEKRNPAAMPTKAASTPSAAPAPAGSLLVYEKGKEIFRLPPTRSAGSQSAPSRNANSLDAVSGTTDSANTDSLNKMQPAALDAPETAGIAPAAGKAELLHHVEPEYPESARQQGIQGAVLLDVRIGRDGGVQQVKILSGDSLLVEAAVAAVRQWRFKPRVVQGQAVEMETQVTLNFQLP